MDMKEARENAGFTQKDAAERLCVSQQAVQQWESGKTVPQADRLLDIARIYGSSVLDVLPKNEKLINVEMDYSKEWEETIEYLKSLPVTNELQNVVKENALRYATAASEYYEGKMICRLLMTEEEHNAYLFWKKNTVLPCGENETLFWKCFFPTDYFRNTSAYHPLMVGRQVAFAENHMGFEPLFSYSEMLGEKYYPELW